MALSLLAWGGQTISWLNPDLGVKWSLMEAEEDVEPTYWADIRGEVVWDGFTLWTMVVAGIFLIIDNSAWPYFGLVGGGMFVYFAGRGNPYPPRHAAAWAPASALLRVCESA